MAQRQFRSDDTSLWIDRYGNGSAGSTVNPVYSQPITGTAGNSYLTYPSGAWASVPQLIVIHQTQGTGASAWELNKITSFNGATANLAYPLCTTYVTGAQMVTLYPYSNISLSGITVSSWNGTTGGLGVWISNGTVTVSGSINASGVGFRGAPAVSGDPNKGRQGEGTPNYSQTQTYTANGNGAGGGGYSTNDVWSQGNGGGGGANHTTNGTNGYGTGGGNNAEGPGGYLGNAAGNSTLISMVLGGGGGSGGSHASSGSSGAGGTGGGIIIIIAKSIIIENTASITLTGLQGGSANYQNGAGGSAAGGSILLKGQTISLGANKISALGGTRVYRNGSTPGDADGGSGGDGRVHVDYSKSIDGTSIPAATTTNDLTLAELAGGSFIWNLI